LPLTAKLHFASHVPAACLGTWDVVCNAEGCLTRLSDAPTDLVIYDVNHFTEAGAIFFVNTIWDRILPPDMQHRASLQDYERSK